MLVVVIDIGPKVFFSNTCNHANDLKVKVTDLEFLCYRFALKYFKTLYLPDNMMDLLYI